jgi:uncharacterized protein (DUF3084 family)
MGTGCMTKGVRPQLGIQRKRLTMAQKPANASNAPADNDFGNPEANVAPSARGAALASDALEAGREYVAPILEAGQDIAERLYEAGGQKAQEAAFYAELGYEELGIWFAPIRARLWASPRALASSWGC